MSINWDARVKHTFGAGVSVEEGLSEGGTGVRFTGIDLCSDLEPAQIELLLDALAYCRVVCIADQDLSKFSLHHFERFSNYWGAPVPHPNNFMRGGKPAQSDSDSDGEFELIPFEKRSASKTNETFPELLQCLPHESPTVLIVSNFSGPLESGREAITGQGGSWHTDIEYEPLPIYVSMFLAHQVPTNRTEDGCWVKDPVVAENELGPYFEGSDSELMRLRLQLPLNGETAFADTMLAFEELPNDEQNNLARMKVRRRLNQGDEGWLAPLVKTNPRSGKRSLHSPIWASRPRVRPPVEIEGLTMDESRELLDRLETHVLQPRYRYDHSHVPGDVTIWDNYMTLHNVPPIKNNVNTIEDARLLYRLSCKGSPVLSLPRQDEPEWLEEHIPGGYITPVNVIECTS